MDAGSAVGQLQEIVAEFDQEISSGQLLSQGLPWVADLPSCSNNPPMLAPNMVASDREQSAPAYPRRKRRDKQSRASVVAANPFTMGLTTPYTDPYGFWSGHGQHFQMSYQPQVPMLAPGPGLTSWYNRPSSVSEEMQGAASHHPSSSRQ